MSELYPFHISPLSPSLLSLSLSLAAGIKLSVQSEAIFMISM